MIPSKATQDIAAQLRAHNPGMLTEAQALEAAAQIGGNMLVNDDGDLTLEIGGKDFVMAPEDLILREVRPSAAAAA